MIRFENLRAGYDGTERLRGVSGALAEGKLTALIGPNGCGKSTLVKCLSGVMRPRSGSILLKGCEYNQIPRKQLARQIAYMPQLRPAPEMTVRQLAEQGRYPHLNWGRGLKSADHEIVDAALARAGADAWAERSVRALSGGERQRAYLAMMLAQQTPVLLLDEPTTWLDPGGQFELMDMLAALAAEGRTVAVVLHDLPLALEYAHRVLLMQAGGIVECGSPEEILASGKMDEVFGVRARRVSGGKYVLSGANGREA